MCPARTRTPPSRAISGKTWPGETMSLWSLVGVDGGGDGAGAVVGGDAGGDALARFDGDGEGGAVARLVLARHVLQAQLVGALAGQRQADEAAAVLGHEVDGVGRGHLRGDDEVALVLAVLGVDQDDHAAVAQILDDLVDGRQEALALGVDHMRQALCRHRRSSSSRAT